MRPNPSSRPSGTSETIDAVFPSNKSLGYCQTTLRVTIPAVFANGDRKMRKMRRDFSHPLRWSDGKIGNYPAAREESAGRASALLKCGRITASLWLVASCGPIATVRGEPMPSLAQKRPARRAKIEGLTGNCIHSSASSAACAAQERFQPGTAFQRR